MAKTRAMFYHVTGASEITVEVTLSGTLEGEPVSVQTNVPVTDPAILTQLAALESAIDAFLGLTP